ncbi:MAG: hypothetical protein FD127_94 [Acidimicrobiaceae bacterium]|nr:MAG: hypothetical protein FD127_94 [Acidimicrobiaceae bacterium]
MAEIMRVCMAVKLSPFGKVNVEGALWTVPHSGSFISFFSSRPVQSPKSHSSRPLSIRTFMPCLAAIGAAVSRARSSGDE